MIVSSFRRHSLSRSRKLSPSPSNYIRIRRISADRPTCATLLQSFPSLLVLPLQTTSCRSSSPEVRIHNPTTLEAWSNLYSRLRWRSTCCDRPVREPLDYSRTHGLPYRHCCRRMRLGHRRQRSDHQRHSLRGYHDGRILLDELWLRLQLEGCPDDLHR